MRILAEVQIVGIENVAWGGDIAIGVVYFTLAFFLAFGLFAPTFTALSTVAASWTRAGGIAGSKNPAASPTARLGMALTAPERPRGWCA